MIDWKAWLEKEETLRKLEQDAEDAKAKGSEAYEAARAALIEAMKATE